MAKKKKRATSEYNKVRKLLWQEFGDSYKGKYTDFIKKGSPVSKVWKDCKGKNCSKEEIIKFYKQYVSEPEAADTTEKPIIPEEYQEPRLFYEIQADTQWGEVWSIYPNLWLVSQALDFPFEVRPMDYDYNKSPSFKTFITFVNEYREYAPYIYLKWTDAYWNEGKKRWETKVLICDRKGKTLDDESCEWYGILVYTEEEKSLDVTLMGKPPKKAEEKAAAPTSEIDKEIEKLKTDIEAVKAKRDADIAATEKLKAEKELFESKFAKLEKLYETKVITKKEYRAALKKLGLLE